MAGRAFVSRFSPNRTDPKVLEANATKLIAALKALG